MGLDDREAAGAELIFNLGSTIMPIHVSGLRRRVTDLEPMVEPC